jgi:Zn-dependent peptidase ImmA (M78 family)
VPSGRFLPFAPVARAIELRAIELKHRLGLAPEAAVKPVRMLSRVPARLLSPLELRQAEPDVARRLFEDARDEWSGICFGRSPVDDVWLILLNPGHAETRRRATLMEEIAHIVLGHSMTRLRIATGDVEDARTFDQAVEDEAYSVGSACLIPYPELFHSIRDDGLTVSQMAERYRVSEEYVRFRVKRAGLFAMLRKRSAPAPRAQPVRNRAEHRSQRPTNISSV